MEHCGAGALSIISLTFGLTAAGSLALAVATEYWLFTEEPVTPPADTGNETLQAMMSSLDVGTNLSVLNGPVIVKTHSGLWRLCVLNEPEEGEPPETCVTIGYFGQSSERFEEADTTTSILRAIRKASPLIVAGLLLLMLALALGIIGTSKNDYKTILSAIAYIFAALLLGMGVIVYISSVNDEVSHRKKTSDNSSPDHSAFHYRYGWAFFLTAITFICSMVASVSNISQYLHRYVTMEDKLLTASGPDEPDEVYGRHRYSEYRSSSLGSAQWDELGGWQRTAGVGMGGGGGRAGGGGGGRDSTGTKRGTNGLPSLVTSAALGTSQYLTIVI